MTRIITIKDTHFRFGFDSPSSRSNSFEEDVDAKINFISDFCIANKIDYIVITGDVFDITSSKKWTLHHINENKKRLQKLKDATGNPILSNAGNHDYIDGFETISKEEWDKGETHLDNTPFGIYIQFGLIQYIGTIFDFEKDKNNNSIPTFENDDIRIFGVDYTKSENLLNILSNIKTDNKKYNISVIHENVADKIKGIENNFVNLEYSSFQKYKDINCWLMGHYHKGYPHKTIDETLFINDWNLTRLMRSYYTLNNSHKPSFSFLEIDNGKLIKSENIEVVYKKYNDAFVEEIKTLNEMIKEDNFAFLKTMKSIHEEVKMDNDNEIIQSIAKKTGTDKEIYEKALSYFD